MRSIFLLAALAALLFGQDLKKALSTPETPFCKGELSVKKTDDAYTGRFTLKVEKSDSPVLELLAVDPLAGNKEETIILYDNGQNGDEIAGDGIYSGTTLIMPASKRRYFIKNRNDKFNTQVLFEYVLFNW